MMKKLCVAILIGIAPVFGYAARISGAGSGDITGVTAGTGLTGGGTSGSVTLNLSPSSTNYIRNTSTLQSGATFYVSSGTVQGQFRAGSIGISTSPQSGEKIHLLLADKSTMTRISADGISSSGYINLWDFYGEYPPGGGANDYLGSLRFTKAPGADRLDFVGPDASVNNGFDFTKGIYYSGKSIPGTIVPQGNTINLYASIGVAAFEITGSTVLPSASATVTQDAYLYLIDASGGASTVKLENGSASAGLKYGRLRRVCKTDDSSNSVTVQSYAAQGSTVTLSYQYECVDYVNIGSGGGTGSWYPIGILHSTQAVTVGTVVVTGQFQDTSLSANLLMRTGASGVLGTTTTVALSELEKDPSQAGTINTSTNPVDWTQLKNVPAGFADGTDATGSGFSIYPATSTAIFPYGINASTGYFSSTMTLSGGRIVTVTAPADGQVLAWDAGNSKWKPSDAGAGDMTKAVYDSGDDGAVDNCEAVENTDMGTLTDTKYCVYDEAGTEIDCNADAIADCYAVNNCETDPNVDTADEIIAIVNTAPGSQIVHEAGGLEADVNAYSGLVAIAGGATAEVDAKSELEAQIADVSDFAEADGDTWTGVHDMGGADSVEMVNGAAPTVDETGEYALDTTDRVLIIYDGYAPRVYATPDPSFSVSISSPPSNTWDNDAWPIFQAPANMAITITTITASALSATASTVTFNLEERAWSALNTAGTNVFTVTNASASWTGNTYGTSDFANAGIAAKSHLVFTTDASASGGAVAKAVQLLIHYRWAVE